MLSDIKVVVVDWFVSLISRKYRTDWIKIVEIYDTATGLLINQPARLVTLFPNKSNGNNS